MNWIIIHEHQQQELTFRRTLFLRSITLVRAFAPENRHFILSAENLCIFQTPQNYVNLTVDVQKIQLPYVYLHCVALGMCPKWVKSTPVSQN